MHDADAAPSAAIQAVIERIDLLGAQVEQFLPFGQTLCTNNNPSDDEGLQYWGSVFYTCRNYLCKCEAIVLVHGEQLEAVSSEHMFRLTKIQDTIADFLLQLEGQLVSRVCHD